MVIAGPSSEALARQPGRLARAFTSWKNQRVVNKALKATGVRRALWNPLFSGRRASGDLNTMKGMLNRLKGQSRVLARQASHVQVQGNPGDSGGQTITFYQGKKVLGTLQADRAGVPYQREVSKGKWALQPNLKLTLTKGKDVYKFNGYASRNGYAVEAGVKEGRTDVMRSEYLPTATGRGTIFLDQGTKGEVRGRINGEKVDRSYTLQRKNGLLRSLGQAMRGPYTEPYVTSR
jgi:hypothetical protein